jgi:hypothetical protein
MLHVCRDNTDVREFGWFFVYRITELASVATALGRDQLQQVLGQGSDLRLGVF